MSKRRRDSTSNESSSRPTSAGRQAKRKKLETSTLSGSTGNTPSTSTSSPIVYGGHPAQLPNIVQDNPLPDLTDRPPSDDSLPTSSQADVQAQSLFTSSLFSPPRDTSTHAPASYMADGPGNKYTSASSSNAHPDRARLLASRNFPPSSRQLRHEYHPTTAVPARTSRPFPSAHGPSHSNCRPVFLNATLYQEGNHASETAASSSSPMSHPTNPLRTGQSQPAQFGSPPPLESLSLGRIGSNGGSAFPPSLSHPSNAQVANSGPHREPPPLHHPLPHQDLPSTTSLPPPPDLRPPPLENYYPRPIEGEQQGGHAHGQPSSGPPPPGMPRLPQSFPRPRSYSVPPGFSSRIPQYRNPNSGNSPEDNGAFSNIVEGPPQPLTDVLSLSPRSVPLMAVAATLLEEVLNNIRDYWNKELQKRWDRLHDLPTNPTDTAQIEAKKALIGSIVRLQENIRSLSDSFSQQDTLQLAILLRDVGLQGEAAVNWVKKGVLLYGGNSKEATTQINSLLSREIRGGRRFLARDSELTIRGEIPSVQAFTGSHDATASGAPGALGNRSQPTSSSRPLLVQRTPIPNTDASSASTSNSQMFSCGDPIYNRSSGECEGSAKQRTGQNALEHLVNHHLFPKEGAWKCFACDTKVSSKENLTRHLTHHAKNGGGCYPKHKTGRPPLSRPKRQPKKASGMAPPPVPPPRSPPIPPPRSGMTQTPPSRTRERYTSPVTPQLRPRNQRFTPSSVEHGVHRPSSSRCPAIPEQPIPGLSSDDRRTSMSAFLLQDEGSGPGPPPIPQQWNEEGHHPIPPPLGYAPIHPQMAFHHTPHQQPQFPPSMARQTQPSAISNSTPLEQSLTHLHTLPSGSEGFWASLRRPPGLEAEYLYPAPTNVHRSVVNVSRPHQPIGNFYAEPPHRVDDNIYHYTHDPLEPPTSTSQWPPPSTLDINPNNLSRREVQGAPHASLGIPTESVSNFGEEPPGPSNGLPGWSPDIAAQPAHLGSHSLEPESSSADRVYNYRTPWKPPDWDRR